MLRNEDKIEVFKAYLSDINDNYADSFKTDILFYFEDKQKNSSDFAFLDNLNSKREIQDWVDNLTSKIVLKYNEDEEQLSDFIFYNII